MGDVQWRRLTRRGTVLHAFPKDFAGAIGLCGVNPHGWRQDWVDDPAEVARLPWCRDCLQQVEKYGIAP